MGDLHLYRLEMRPLGMHVGAMMEKLVHCHGNTEHSGMNWLVFSSLCIVSVLCLKHSIQTARQARC